MLQNPTIINGILTRKEHYMTFEELYRIKNDEELTNRTYDIFNEDVRLNHSKAARVEFLTTVHYIEKYLPSNAKILDIGAGAGEYSIYFAKKGYQVSALELADNNIRAFRQKITPDTPIDLVQGNALDLSRYPDESFDVVFLFGPLYHLRNATDRAQCINEAKRVCKKEGTLFFSFIGNDMVILTELVYDNSYLKGNTYDHNTFKVEDFPFVFFTVDQCRQMLLACDITLLHEVASDGVSELLEEKINQLDEESYEQYLKYHFYCCEKPEMLGHSNHLLFVGKK